MRKTAATRSVFLFDPHTAVTQLAWVEAPLLSSMTLRGSVPPKKYLSPWEIGPHQSQTRFLPWRIARVKRCQSNICTQVWSAACSYKMVNPPRKHFEFYWGVVCGAGKGTLASLNSCSCWHSINGYGSNAWLIDYSWNSRFRLKKRWRIVKTSECFENWAINGSKSIDRSINKQNLIQLAGNKRPA